jgi:hypothetical protein
MRAVVVIAGLSMAAGVAAADVAPPPPPPPPASAVAGTWSFDGSCASGFGMVLSADGNASYDEWGEGLWALADNGKRIVLIAEDITEEADRRKVAELIEFRINARATTKLSLTRLSDGAKLAAMRCPSN